MSDADLTAPHPGRARGGAPAPRPVLWTLAGAAIVAELVAITALYAHGFEFDCRAAGPDALCAALSRAVPRAVAMLAALALALWLRPELRALLGRVARPRPHAGWAAAQVAAAAAITLPWLMVRAGGDAAAPAALAVWTLAGAGAAGTAFLAVVDGAGLRRLARRAGPLVLGALGVAAVSPELALGVQHVWVLWDPLTDVTFAAVVALVGALGYETIQNPSVKLIGIDEFRILVGRQCSGVEGFLLITSFVGLYLGLFRRSLRWPHAWLLIPLGLMASWTLNVVRISALLMIGHHVSPALAVEGFHSYAGWLMFTALALGIAGLAHRVPALRAARAVPRAAAPAPPPLRRDPAAAMLLRHFAFVVTAILAGAFAEVPAAAYPLRAALTAAVLLAFWPALRGLDWGAAPRWAAIAGVSGAALGLAWAATQAPPETDALAGMAAAMGPWGFAAWVLVRVAAFALLVPVIEELAFRGYLQPRLAALPALGAWGGVLIAAAAFAALHDRWLAAFAAGVLFGWLRHRTGRVMPAVIAHAAANGAIAAAALGARAWWLI